MSCGVVSRGGNCRWSSRQPRRCTRCSPAGPAAERGSASSTRCATDRGCGPGGTAARPRRSSTRRRYPPADTVPDPAAAGMAARKRTAVKRHLAVEVNGLLLTVVVTAASIPDRDAAHRLLAALRGSFSTIGLVWADGGYLGRCSSGRKTFSPLLCRSSNASPAALVSPSGPHLGGREKFRVDQPAPPLRARPRNQSRPPRSHGPPRHDHDHDQTTRPNLTVFKHPLRDAQTDPCLVSRETGVIRSCLNRRSRTSPSAATQGNKHCVQNSAPPGPLGGLPEGHVESIDGSDQQAKGIMCDVR